MCNLLISKEKLAIGWHGKKVRHNTLRGQKKIDDREAWADSPPLWGHVG